MKPAATRTVSTFRTMVFLFGIWAAGLAGLGMMPTAYDADAAQGRTASVYYAPGQAYTQYQDVDGNATIVRSLRPVSR